MHCGFANANGDRAGAAQEMNVPIDFQSIAFIDIEASSLGSLGFPTEVGWAIISRDGAVYSDACLIKPAWNWTLYENAWSPASEALTGITRQMLERDGLSPAEAMKRFLEAVGERGLVSDAPDFDTHWLGMLADAAGISLRTLTIGDAKAVIGTMDDRHGVVDGSPVVRHRAEPDARRLAIILKNKSIFSVR